MSTEANEDRILAALEQLNARLDRIEAKVDRAEAAVQMLDTFASRVPTLADAAGTTAAWAWSQAESKGIDPIATGQRAAALGLDLASEENISLIERLLSKRQDLEMALDALEGIDAEDLRTITTKGAALTKQLATVLRSPEFTRVVEASTDPSTLSTAEYASTALIETRSQQIPSVGLFGVLSQMGDADVQRAVGFTFAVAKRFGQLLDR